MESLVRPFASPTPLATRRVISQNKTIASQQVLIAWGQPGTLPTPTKEEPGQLSFKIENCNDSFKEKNRETHDQTITDNASGASVTFSITDKIIFSKAPADSQNVGNFRTETTAYSVADPFAGTSFGDVPKGQLCDSSYVLNNADNGGA